MVYQDWHTIIHSSSHHCSILFVNNSHLGDCANGTYGICYDCEDCFKLCYCIAKYLQCDTFASWYLLWNTKLKNMLNHLYYSSSTLSRISLHEKLTGQPFSPWNFCGQKKKSSRLSGDKMAEKFISPGRNWHLLSNSSSDESNLFSAVQLEMYLLGDTCGLSHSVKKSWHNWHMKTFLKSVLVV